MAELDLVRGTLDMLVLKALIWGPRHGYAVTAWIRAISAEELQVEDGALYAALHRLAARGVVETEWGLSDNNRKAKYYRLTAAGRRRLGEETASWNRLVEAIARALAVTPQEI